MTVAADENVKWDEPRVRRLRVCVYKVSQPGERKLVTVIE